jgi:hypothetical protein
MNISLILRLRISDLRSPTILMSWSWDIPRMDSVYCLYPLSYSMRSAFILLTAIELVRANSSRRVFKALFRSYLISRTELGFPYFLISSLAISTLLLKTLRISFLN